MRRIVQLSPFFALLFSFGVVVADVQAAAAVRTDNCDMRCREKQNHRACGYTICYYWSLPSCILCVKQPAPIVFSGACFKDGSVWDSGCIEGGTNTRYEYADCLTKCDCIGTQNFNEAPAQTITEGATTDHSLYTCQR